jgi:hypothetical protein
LPVPLSPVMSTDVSLSAMACIRARSSRITGERPTMAAMQGPSVRGTGTGVGVTS